MAEVSITLCIAFGNRKAKTSNAASLGVIAYARVRFYPIFFAVRSAFTTFVSMNWKKLSLLVLLLLVADQALKIWI